MPFCRPFSSQALGSPRGGLQGPQTVANTDFHISFHNSHSRFDGLFCTPLELPRHYIVHGTSAYSSSEISGILLLSSKLWVIACKQQ